MFFKKNKDDIPLVQFFAQDPNLKTEVEIHPYPASKKFPYWWKNMPTYTDFIDNTDAFDYIPTIKKCPALPDFFSQGYIVPMWSDLDVKHSNGELILNETAYGFDVPKWLGHENIQFVSYMEDLRVGNRKIEATIKACSPWYVVTPPGWSTLVLPFFYDFETNYTIMPGIIDTDIHHQMNHPMLVHSDNKNFSIKKGEAFVVYIPFKRSSTNYEVVCGDQKQFEYFHKVNLELSNLRVLKNPYRKKQRKRDYNL